MNRCLIGDCRELLPTLPSDSVNCCITSPPYWGLRDYGVEGQLGLEATLQDYVERMVAIFREVRRVLRDDGTLWLNLGDSYAGGGHGGGGSFEEERNWRKGSGRADGLVDQRGQRNRDGLGRVTGLKPKDLVGVPWRVAFALQADGWYLRQDIIWAKPNPMPESVRDRCTKAHEYLFLLAKSERYYFDADAIAEQSISGDLRKPYAPGQVDSRGNGHDRGGGELRRSAHMVGTPRNDGDRWRIAEGGVAERGNRNKRSVWTVSTQPYSEAHFATFPPALIEPCILAGCPSGGTVLDPFIGSGTVAEVAQNLGRQWLGIELNPEYAKMLERRSAQQGMQFA